jgi:predicted metallopeptidase
MKQEFARAPDVAAVAARLIEHFHPHLEGVRVEYVFTAKPIRSGGRELAGRARVVRGLMAYVATPEHADGEAEPFFVIEISRRHWLLASPAQKVALVDHELTHCGFDDERGALCIVPHDVEEFHVIAARHGRWTDSLEIFGEALNSDAHRVGHAERIELAAGSAEAPARGERIAALREGRGRRERVEALLKRAA